ncbi:MAG: [protein-PII] uridylyltransferase [Alphaproteobacteria bacterium]|nr:[protein-PII] uridylyltransferase [Alphaproteobacteria bacterium]
MTKVNAPFDADALRHRLTALAQAEADKAKLRAAALVLLKHELHAARDAVRARVETNALAGLDAARALSALQDALVQVLYDFATKHFYYAQNPTTAEHLAVVATGGYGRGELAPGSDIDLLFVHPQKRNPWTESVIEFTTQMLWDLGLKVGSAARSLAECARLARSDVTIRTALLEARLVAGDPALFDEMRKAFWSEAGGGPDFVAAKLAERDARHTRQGASRYLVEPNVKEGKGGLRDLQTLYWIGKYLYRTDDASELARAGMFSDAELATFRHAESFLWDVRVRLHYLTGRAEERLSFDVQPALAEALGFGAGSDRHAVEAFMKAYFLVAKDVGDLTRIVCAALEEQNRKPKPALSRLLPGFLKPRSGDEDFYVENGRLNAHAGAFARDPKGLIRIFHIADEKKVDVHPSALRTITRSLDLVDDRLRADSEANRLFLEILTSRRDPERALRRMNEAGVLGRFVPEFGRVVALMQFNAYHHFTVDEHLIRAVGNVAAIERGELKSEHPLSSDIVKRIKSREALYCAMLLHDIAKGMKGDHSDEGAHIAQTLCPRLGLSPEDTAAVAWLVRNHLAMSDTAQKRDISDPKTVRDFVDVVQSPELLRLLLILTVADIRAVGPGVWNGWKGQLLRELYYEAEAVMTGGDAAPARAARLEDARQALSLRIADLPEAARAHALARHTDSYWLAFDTNAQERHARLMSRADATAETVALSAESNDFRAVTEIVIYTRDSKGLFAKLAGAISISGGSIVDSKIFTTADGYALDVFSVQDAHGGPFGDAERAGRLHHTIRSVLDPQARAGAVFAQRRPRRRANAFHVRPRVRFDNDASILATVIEVEGLDRPGLLHDVAQALLASELSVSSAIVSTYGERAMDVFYVRDKFGHKIVHPERIKAVEERLLEALAGETPIHHGRA